MKNNFTGCQNRQNERKISNEEAKYGESIQRRKVVHCAILQFCDQCSLFRDVNSN